MRAYFYFLILLQIPFPLFCQQKNIRFQHLPTDAGLSQSDVLCILQDSRGFMWFGTEDGLNKYDRQKNSFIHFTNDPKNSSSISDNYVGCLLKDDKGNIWAGTSNGIDIFDKKNNSFI